MGLIKKEICQFVAHVLGKETNFFSLNSACAAAFVAASFLDLLDNAPGSIVRGYILHRHFQCSSRGKGVYDVDDCLPRREDLAVSGSRCSKQRKGISVNDDIECRTR